MRKIFFNYAKYYNLIYQNKDYKKEAEFVYKWANKPKTILELGCGTGQHAKYWVDKADIIYAVDNSQEMISQAFKHPKIKYMNIPLQDLDYETKFDCVFALFNVMGYTLLELSLGKIPIAKDGIFIFDIWDKDKVKKDGFTITIKEYSWGKVIIYPLKEKTGIAKLKIAVMPKKGKSFVEYHTVRSYSLGDIEKLCQKYSYLFECKDTNSWVTWYKLIKK